MFRPFPFARLRWKDCFGAYTWPNGQKYVGEFHNGKRHGEGTLTLPNGFKYVGEFRNDQYNGQGTLSLPDGRKYVGEFRDGRPNGQVTFTAADGSKYVGEFDNGKPQGRCTYTWPNGEKYVGEFRDDNLNGQGVYTWPNGEKYVGEFRYGKAYGWGTLTWPNGQKYVGGFCYGKFHGQGTLTLVDGRELVGEFRNGKYQGWQIDQPILHGRDIGLAGTSTVTSPAASGEPTEVPMVSEGGTLKVPVLINDVVLLHFTIDSGASDVAIPADVVRTLYRTGTLTDCDFLGTRTYVLADGSTIPSETFHIQKLKVGNRVVEDVVGSIANIEGHLLLGQSFLSKLNSWQINNERQVLILQ